MSSLITMYAAVLSVNRGLNVKPSDEKKSMDDFRFLTGKLTKNLRAIMFSPLKVALKPAAALESPFSLLSRTSAGEFDILKNEFSRALVKAPRRSTVG